jgi:hypothetical protein
MRNGKHSGTLSGNRLSFDTGENELIVLKEN